MSSRRFIGQLLNIPLKKAGLKIARLAAIEQYEARLNDLSRSLAEQALEMSRQRDDDRRRWQTAEAAIERQKREAAASLRAAVAAERAHGVALASQCGDAERSLGQLRRQLAPAAALPLPIYLTDDLRPAAQPTPGASPHRIIVCSIPKAGTYLVDRLLELLGCVPSRLHLSRLILTDYRFATVREARENYERLLADVPLEAAVELHLPGQFSVGHLGCDDQTRRILSDVKKLFVYRDLRDGLVSFLRFLASTGRGGEATRAWKDLPPGPEQMLRFLDAAGQDYFNMTLPMIDWLDQPDAFPISFETLYGDAGTAEQRALLEGLHAFLELPGVLPNLDTLCRSLIGAPTMTWSGGRVSRETYWSDAVERRFAAFGGAQANRRLGYDASDKNVCLRMPPAPARQRHAA